MKRFLFLLVFILPLLLPPTSTAQLEGLVIVIDPGHGGYGSNDRHLVPDPGIDFYESESNFYKALHVKGLLEAQGAIVHLTRTTNDSTIIYPNPSDPYEPTLTARWTLANSVSADWFHSIHSNAFNGSVNYTIVLLKEEISTRQPAFPEAVNMSSNVYNQIRAHIRTSSSGGNIPGYPGVYMDYTFYGGTNGGYNLGVLSGLTMPGELSEGSFHDFFPETRRLMNNDYRKMEAYGLMKAFLEYFGAPADSLGIIAGIQKNPETLLPQNGTVVRLLPENRTYNGDSFNNGFFMFDSLTPGPHSVIFDTPGFVNDTVGVVVNTGGIHFVDRTLVYWYPAVIQTSPADGDTATAVNSPVSIRFSLAMDTASVRQALSVSPSANSSLSWSADLKQLTMTFSPALEYYIPYTVTIDSAAKAMNGYGVDINGDEIGGDTLVVTFQTESSLQASPVPFGQVRIADTSGITLIIRNRGDVGVVVTGVLNSTAQFWATPTLPDTIAAADSTTIDMWFTPGSYGSFSDAFIISSDRGTIVVSATGSSLAPNLIPSHTLLGFSTVTTDTSKDRPFWLRTTSVNNVRVDSMRVKTESFQYSPAPSFPVILGLSDTLRLTVMFAPQAVGTVVDTLFIFNNSSVNPVKVALTGNGILNSAERISEQADHFAISQNYPNPFNPETTIEFQVPESSPVVVEIVDILGQTIRTLVSRDLQRGTYSAIWDARDERGFQVSTGIYFYRITAGEFMSTKKMVLMK